MTCPLAPRPRSRHWYGEAAAWWVPFQRDARRKCGDHIQISRGPGTLTYETGLEVPGIQAPVPVRVVFYANPPYPTYGLPPEDYPRVWADPGASSPHRMPDGSLCLYYPHDPPERRWHSDLGLLTLLDLTRDHLFFEHYWRSTGGTNGGIWLGPEADHGFPAEMARI